ncbi:MAG TPA: TadE family protein [Rhizomicrobium sp.]|jgi:Flp pilus assembly protein TadG|nr:TadE family protein [Rhizomicrobium sp.]
MKHMALFDWLEDERGSPAVEFALVGPVFLLLLVGTIYVGLLLFSTGSLQYAVEEGARCASVKTTVCTNSAATITYTTAAYYGPIIAPTFTSSTQACGHAVSGSANFNFDFGLRTLTVPLSATSCFP